LSAKEKKEQRRFRKRGKKPHARSATGQKRGGPGISPWNSGKKKREYEGNREGEKTRITVQVVRNPVLIKEPQRTEGEAGKESHYHEESWQENSVWEGLL